MKRRIFLGSGLALTLLPRALAGFEVSRLEDAGKILADAAESGDVESSALYVQQGSDVFSRSYGLAHDTDAIFLLASISKTIAVASVTTLFDEGHFRLDENAQQYLPEFQIKVHHT
jgi:CubicO group peptidase (beta-lactamase class C family)